MMSKLTPDRLFVLIPIVAIIASLVAGIVLLFPKDPVRVSAADQKRREMAIIEDASKVARQGEAYAEQIQELTWVEQPEQVEPRALDIVSRVADRSRTKILGFRPQRTVLSGGLEQLPFLVTLEGSFPNILTTARDLGTRSNRLAVTSIQVASADAASDRVTATVGIVAFRLPEGGSK